ncbi:truncated hemoglobin GlbN [Seminavis robusta]|uniref:Truncated hemoglobin GlbN n=1 Tax=Seminavis robusta TaxID=568900 RepID=A0A9N8DB72_9STRA|nr:truncated hemoglobin GlbN [Seminavis robusta]|eukprot:Sro41_g025290.1 truncated hemoglobin GlbN (178) ;mRNA; r:109168-109701
MMGIRNSLGLSTREVDSSSKHDHSTCCNDVHTCTTRQCPTHKLLDRLGGMMALQSIVQDFGSRISNDVDLAPFFQGVDYKLVSSHQKMFFAMALTNAPDNEAMETTLRRHHQHLFAQQGLNEHHFDLVANHLMESLVARGFQSDILEEVATIMKPMRQPFLVLSREATLSNSLGPNE